MDQTPAETPAVSEPAQPSKPLPVKVPQPHGGALYRGGLRGNGGGRPPSALRAKLRGSFEKRLKVLEEIADNRKAQPADRIRAIDLLGKYGIGQLRELSVEAVREKVRRTIEVISESLPPEESVAIISRLRLVWID